MQVEFDVTSVEAFVLQFLAAAAPRAAVAGASENRQAGLSKASRDLESDSLVGAAD